MNVRRATKIAIDCIEAEIKRLAVHANLHDTYHADAPVCIEASKRRQMLRDAIKVLKQEQQVTF